MKQKDEWSSTTIKLGILLLVSAVLIGGVYIVFQMRAEPSDLSRQEETKDNASNLIKEKLKITTVQKINGKSTENIDIIPWRPMNMVDILVKGYMFKYRIESDIQLFGTPETPETLLEYGRTKTFEDVGVESDYLNALHFDQQLTVHLTRPSFMTDPQDEVLLTIKVWDHPTLDSIIQFGGWNDLTLTIEWQQPDQSLPPNAVIWKRINVTVIEEGAAIYQEIFSWKPTDIVSVSFEASGEGQTLEYKVETDLETHEGVGEVSGFRTGAIRFDNRITVNVTPTPMGQANVRLTIYVDDKYRGTIAEYSGWNDLTMMLEWMQP